jgi:hypothetical protein
VGAGVLLFRFDAFRWENWWIYCLFVIPLLVALWLLRGYDELPLRRLPNAN